MTKRRESASTPVVSRSYDDGTLIELVYEPGRRRTALAVRRPDASREVVGELTAPTGERLRPYSPTNSLIASGAVVLPSGLETPWSKERLLGKVRAYLRRYVDLDAAFEEIAAHYVLLTWVYDAFSDLPYLRFRGDFGTGKTRALLVLGQLCYKAFFASGASTVSPIFHILDAFQGTLILDEADLRFSDATADLIKVLNHGNSRGLPVLRTMSNRDRELNPRAFQVFGPKIVAMRTAFSDPALESRFITEETGGRGIRPEVPLHLPVAHRREAAALRNRLLAFRFAHRDTLQIAAVVEGLGPRANQTALALLSLIDDPATKSAVVKLLLSREQAATAARSQTLEAAMIRALLASFSTGEGPTVAVSVVAGGFNAIQRDELGREMSPRWVGDFLRNRLHLETRKSHGLYGVPREALPRVVALAARFGVDAGQEAGRAGLASLSGPSPSRPTPGGPDNP